MLRKIRNLNLLEKTIFIGILITILIIAIYFFLRLVPPHAQLLIALLMIIVLVLLGLFFKTYFDLVNKQRKLSGEYETAKNTLRKDPRNSKLREAALLVGRKYYSSLRESVYGEGMLTIYDEQAIR